MVGLGVRVVEIERGNKISEIKRRKRFFLKIERIVFLNLINREEIEKLNFFLKILKIENRKRNENSVFLRFFEIETLVMESERVVQYLCH